MAMSVRTLDDEVVVLDGCYTLFVEHLEYPGAMIKHTLFASVNKDWEVVLAQSPDLGRIHKVLDELQTSAALSHQGTLVDLRECL